MRAIYICQWCGEIKSIELDKNQHPDETVVMHCNKDGGDGDRTWDFMPVKEFINSHI